MKKTDSIQSRKLDYWNIKRLFMQPGKSIGHFCKIYHGGITYGYFGKLVHNNNRDVYQNIRRPPDFDRNLARYLKCKIADLCEPLPAPEQRVTASPTI